MMLMEDRMVRRVRIEYFDQNEQFSRLLPRSVEVVGPRTDVYGNTDWFWVRLDEPLEYQLKVGDWFKFQLVCASHFLIRSRWLETPICAGEEPSVFILLVEASKSSVPDRFDPTSYAQAAWGTCVVEE
jgi:hypothetical protein